MAHSRAEEDSISAFCALGAWRKVKSAFYRRNAQRKGVVFAAAVNNFTLETYGLALPGEGAAACQLAGSLP